MRLALVALLLLAVVAPVAEAAFPGRNGPLVVAVEVCGVEHRYLASTPWRGGPLTPLTPECQRTQQEGQPGLDVWAPDAAPDGSGVLAVQREYPYEIQSGDCPCAFTFVPADGTERRKIPYPPHIGYAEEVSLSPSGDRFAYQAYLRQQEPETDVFETRIDGSRTREISGRDAFTQPRWSPDGKLIAVVVNQYDRTKLKPGIWLIRAGTGRLVRRVAKQGAWVDWSPDGRKLVYGTFYGRSGGRATGGNLYVVGRNGRKARELVHRDAIAEANPAWSPDGRWISWVSLRFDGGGDVFWRIHASLWRVRSSGGKPQRIRSLPSPDVDEGEYNTPGLTWLPRPR
jgi:dipeptidyl aminopeptidase/acylaminoacyl peptidase